MALGPDAIISIVLIILFGIVGLLLLNWIYSTIMYKWNAYLEGKATQIHTQHQDDDRRHHEDEYSVPAVPPPSNVPRSARSRSRSKPRNRFY